MSITIEELNKRPLSYSSLKEFKKSPIHFMHYRTKTRREETDDMIFGSMVDCALFEPDQFEDRYAIMPEFGDCRNKDNAAKKKDFFASLELQRQKAKEDKKEKWPPTYVAKEDLEKAKMFAEKISKHPVASTFINQLEQTQETINWVDKATGLPLTAKIDGRCPTILLDLKTTDSADPDDFIRSVMNYDYYLQMAVYREAVKRTKFQFPDSYFLVIEKKEPFGISVLSVPDDMIELGDLELRHYLTSFKHCMDNNLFHQGYEYRSPIGSYIPLTLPGWAKHQIERYK